MAIACRLCDDPACVIACPREALLLSEETGVIIVDEKMCNGYAWCVGACDFGSIQLHPESRVNFVCVLCNGEPQCVEWCPEEALDFNKRSSCTKGVNINYKEAVPKSTNRYYLMCLYCGCFSARAVI